ncbi:uncharacterized protein [Watersipora subatra]|uniref:uncharacterized protein n=1 Tax=Watersipora subatra TaxID=2589382 RepID=UPI00355C1D2A
MLEVLKVPNNFEDCSTPTYDSRSSGTLTSDGYDGSTNYSPDLDCEWNLVTPSSAKVIVLNINNMDIYKNDSLTCQQADYLKIENYEDASDVWGDHLCGTQTDSIIGTSHKAKIIFHTSSFGGGTGFSLTWSTQDPPTSASESSESTTTAATKAPVLDTTYIILIAVGAAIVIFPLIGVGIKKCMSSSSNDFSSRARVSDEPTRVQKPIPQPQVTQYSSPATRAYSTNAGWSPGMDLTPAPIKPKAENKVKADDLKPVLPHIMISYQWDVKPEILEFREKLGEAGYRVWIDVEQMHKGTSTFESMARAVNNAVVVIPVLTDKYQKSINCRKEIEFADKCNKTLVPIRMQEDFKMEGWLDFLIGGSYAHTLCNDDIYDEELEKLFKTLSVTAKTARETPEEDKSED